LIFPRVYILLFCSSALETFGSNAEKKSLWHHGAFWSCFFCGHRWLQSIMQDWRDGFVGKDIFKGLFFDI